MSVLRASVTERLDAAGSFSVELPATDQRLFPVPATVNLFTNPSFENDINAVSSPTVTLAQDATQFKYGTKSLKATYTGGFTEQINFKTQSGANHPVTAGEWYGLALWLMSGTAAGTMHMGFQWLDADGAPVQPVATHSHSWGLNFTRQQLITVTAGMAWTRYWFSAKAPPGAVTARVNLEENIAIGAGETLYIDGVTFAQVKGDPGDIDGDQDGCSWDGTAHASTSRRAGSASPLSRGTIWRHYREGEGFVFAGLIEEIVTTPDGGKLISGPTLLGQLLYDNTLRGYTFSSQSLNTVTNALLANTGWARNGSVATTITVRFDMESRLKALSDAVTQVGSHFRENVTEVAGALVRTLDIGSAALGNASGVVISGGNPDSLLADDAALALAEDVKVTESSADIWNWLLPLGSGDGTTQLTLQFSTRTTPYRVLKRRDLAGNKRLYFIADYTVWDSFERVDGAIGSADTAQAWTAATGTWVILTLLARASVLVGGVARAVIAAGVSDGIVGVRIPNGYAQAGTGLIFRYSDADNHFFVDTTATGLQLVRRQATVETVLATYTGLPSAPVEIAVVLDGPSITVLVDGVVRMTATDTFNQSATSHGMVTKRTDTRHDDFFVAGSATSIAQYGRRMRPFAAKEIGALSNTPVALTTAANALYDLAATHLTYWRQAPTVYGFRVRGLAASVKPGDSVRFRYRGVAQHWEVGAVYIDVDADFYILQRTRTFDTDGSEVSEVVISSVARMLETSNDLVIGKIEETARVIRSHVATSVSNYSAGPIVEELESGTPMQFDVFIDDNVLHLLRCKVRFKPRAIRSPVDSTPAGGSTTSGAETTHTHTVTIAAHNHTFTGQSSAAAGAHTHRMFDYQADASPGGTDRLFHYRVGATTTRRAWLNSEAAEDISTHEEVSTHTHSLTGVTSDNGGSSTPTSSGGASHSHTVPDHNHTLAFGIFEGTSASTIRILINGVDRTAALGGPWAAAATVDITPYLLDSSGLVVQGVHAIEFQSATLGRIEAWVDLIVAVQAVIG